MRILLLLLLINATTYAQKLQVNEVDKFTHQKRLETSRTFLKNRMSEGIGLTLRSVDTSLFIKLYGWGAGTSVIGAGDLAIFLLENDSTFQVYSTGVQDYSIDDVRNSYSHQYRINADDIGLLAEHGIKSIRKYTARGYADIDIPEKNRSDFKRTAQLFYSEYRKS